MSPLGRKIVVYSMLWVMLAMVVSQVYDNVRGKGMPVRPVPSTTVEPSAEPDPQAAKLVELQNCVAADPNNVQCTADLARLYYASQQWPQAQANYERAVVLRPHDVELLKQLAGTYIYQQKFEQAAATLQQAVILSPSTPEIRLLLGLALSKLDPPRTDEAITEWREVIQIAPDSPWAKQAAEFIESAGK